jgi:hypothetical protein
MAETLTKLRPLAKAATGILGLDDVTEGGADRLL